MRTRSRFLLGVAVLVAGLLLGFGDLFLVVWGLKSGRAHDVRARGPWLMAMVLPQIGIATAVVATVVASLAARHVALPLALRLGAPAAATVVLYSVLHLDRGAHVWRALRPLRGAIGLPGALVLDLVLIAGAVVVLLRTRDDGDLHQASATPFFRSHTP